jgi:mono/diheme cytochrome c family protein
MRDARARRGAPTLAALLIFATALPGCATREIARSALAPPGPKAIADAANDFREACAACHGLDARGGGPVAESLRTPPPDLTLLAARHGDIFPSDDVVAVIAGERAISAHGSRAMPIWSQRFGPVGGATAAASIHTRHRLEMLARYLATLQRSP